MTEDMADRLREAADDIVTTAFEPSRSTNKEERPL
jgi:hypothetical protein